MSEAIVGGTIIDGLGGDPIEKGVVLFENGRITKVGPESAVTVPQEARKIDAAGRVVMPGIIDTHVHATYRARDMRQHLLNTPTYNILRSTSILKETLEAGITTVRDMGGADAGFREAVADGFIDGPRLLISLIMMSQTGGHGDQWVPAGMRIQKRAWLPSAVADGVEGVRQKVRHCLMAGADFIKICTGGGITSVTDSWDEPQYSVEEVKTAVVEAAFKKRRVAAHAEGLEPIRTALAGGIHSLEHGWAIDEESIDTMIAQDTWWVPTLALVPMSVEKRKKDDAWSSLQLGDEASKDHEIYTMMQDQKPIWHEAVRRGVKIAMGTDQSHRLLVGENMVELKFMVDWLGMSPMEVIVASTSKAAECIERPELGALESGRIADILIVDGNPVDDIQVLEDRNRIHMIMKDGKAYKDRLNS